MKNIVLLGSTGSIGTQTLDVIRSHPEEFRIVGLSAHENVELFERQVREFQPKHTLLTGMSENPAAALSALAALPEADLVVNAIGGTPGLGPTIATVQAGKRLALANKESIVMAGELIMATARQTGAQILPVDSEPSAIWQMIGGKTGASAQEPPRPAPHSSWRENIEAIILTASGGPFWKWRREELEKVSAAEALKHPTWKMGEKISVDSATLMNKAFEIIETRWLFDIPPEKIEVTVHRQSIVHALVRFCDGTMSAAMSAPDMKIPIGLALFHPERPPRPPARLDLNRLTLSFEAPDYSVFEGPRLAYEVLKEGGIMPAVFCLADEIAVTRFLHGELPFLRISEFVKRTLNTVKNMPFSLAALTELERRIISSQAQ